MRQCGTLERGGCGEGKVEGKRGKSSTKTEHMLITYILVYVHYY